jgi:hypothetical protein
MKIITMPINIELFYRAQLGYSAFVRALSYKECLMDQGNTIEEIKSFWDGYSTAVKMESITAVDNTNL